MLWLCNPAYIRDVVVPEVTAGRERAGKPLEGFDVVAAVPVALTDDADAARATMRQDLVAYAPCPSTARCWSGRPPGDRGLRRGDAGG